MTIEEDIDHVIAKAEKGVFSFNELDLLIEYIHRCRERIASLEKTVYDQEIHIHTLEYY